MIKLPLITIQILNWNRVMETLRAIESAIQQTYPNTEIVVVDNGSEDDSVKLIKENFPGVNLIELDKNYGCPGGRNRGIPYCNGEYIFYLDNDGVLHEDAVLNAYKAAISETNIGVVTGIIYDFNHEKEIDTNCTIRSSKRYLFNNFQGGISMHLKEIYNSAGYYPDHFMYGAEEYFLMLKLMDTKYSIIKDESVVLWHKKSDLARNREKELISGYSNKLFTVVALYPLLSMLLFLVRYIFVYPYYAYKKRILHAFLVRMKKDFLSILLKGIKSRKPVSYKAFYRYRRLLR